MIHFFSTNFIWIPTILKSKTIEKKSFIIWFRSFDFSLKREQGLLIDFNAFPQHIIDYLKLCIRDQHNDSPPMKWVFTKEKFSSWKRTNICLVFFSGSRFQLQLVHDEQQLNNDQSLLRVVEIS